MIHFYVSYFMYRILCIDDEEAAEVAKRSRDGDKNYWAKLISEAEAKCYEKCSE